MPNANARLMRKMPTDAERHLWRHLRLQQCGGLNFRRQHPMGPYIVDFMCLQKKPVIELDGGHHSEQTLQDAERTTWLESRGYRVLRFWNNQVLQETGGVLQTILSALENNYPPHQSSPLEGEEEKPSQGEPKSSMVGP
ncbi:MAG: endonuclease domain-containing protein [Dehalococcoidia bacterium]|nr:endonuclease domain-containing protein [Dehalococcoidia bacterium]